MIDLWILLTAILSASPSTSSPDLLSRMRVRQAELESLRARLEQTKSYPQLGLEDPTERGRLYLDRRGRSPKARVEIESPEARILTVKDGNYLLYQPRLRQAVSGKLGTGTTKTGLFSGVLMGSPGALDELENGYEARELDGNRLEFTARPGAEVYCRRIELWLDEKLLLPIRQTCEEANRSVITFSLSELETNVALDAKLFEIELPPGVERVKN
jgi:outer membrane lipoprotein-sorting protein